MAVLFADSFQRQYRANASSKSALICYLFMVMAFIMPLILVIKTHNFWVTNLTTYEQPRVTHLNEIVVVYQTTNGIYQASLNAKVGLRQQDITPSFNIKNEDTNEDGLNERITVKIDAQIDPSTLKSIAIIQQFSYEIKSKVYADIKLTSYNFIQTPYGADSVQIAGSIGINQRNPYEMGSVKRIVNYESDNLQTFLNRNTLDSLLNQISDQNTTCHITEDYLAIVPASGTYKQVQISFMIKVPSMQEINYVPTTLESLKMAWIQYIALLIPSLYVIYWLIIGFAFKNKVLDAQVKNEIQDELFQYEKGYMYSRKF
ncbi:hypothetical protein FGO68_gene16267 [Halteria grandinella]|uniref:Transmembrane protein 231 n=1 Tax=Halteria grandinella TaxID=5974 RepID=A0A8J8T6R4_HALGN|nr:hypothetical protein FGO68_gene16267 [Halteria grandinella]